MKTIEEKARAYDEVFTKAAALYKASEPMSGCNVIIETLFPEIKESEDEKIRKSLIILLQHFCKGYRVPGLEFPVSYKDMLAWLEKQKPIEWSEEDDSRYSSCLYMVERETSLYNWLKSLKDRVQPKQGCKDE